MKNFIFLLALMVGLLGTAYSQTARVQILHNSPDPTVDVYVNGQLAINDFAFRTATPYLDLPAGINLSVAVAPASSASVADAIATFPVQFESGKSYLVAASGLVGNPVTPFTLLAKEGVREVGSNPSKVDVSIFHGSPNAPAVDVDAVLVASGVVTNLGYGQSTPYLSLDPGVYDFAVRAAGTSTVVATYRADLSALSGRALTVFASGLLGANPAFGVYALLEDGTVLALPLTPTARVQAIHNSPSPVVDVYAGNTLLIDNFAYRTATPYVSVPADRPIALGVAGSGSAGVGEAIYTRTATFNAGTAYQVFANGVVGDTLTPFGLSVFEGQATGSDSALVDVRVFHGSTNAPSVDVDATFVAPNVVTNLAFGNMTDYLDLPTAKYDLAVRSSGTPGVLASYRADLTSLGGKSVTLFASGRLGGDPGFGLFAVLSTGQVLTLPLTPTALLQVVHNSPDPVVDVYAGFTRLLDDFNYRTATPFVAIPADVDIPVGIALPNSSDASEVFYSQTINLPAGGTFVAFASGVVGDPNTPFILLADAARTTSSNPATVEFAVLHGATNAPAVDIEVAGVGNLLTNVSYGTFSPYLGVPAGDYQVAVKVAGTADVVGTYRVNLSGLTGAAARVFASGLVGGTPEFGLFAALPDGTVIQFPAVTTTATARLQVIHNSPSPTVDVYVNNVLLLNDFTFRSATPFLDVPAGVVLNIGVAPANSQSPSDIIANFPVTLEAGKRYLAVASGVLGNPLRPFTILVNDAAREVATVAGNVDVTVLHGSPNAPAVDVDALFVADNIVSGLAYGNFTPYLELPADKYDLAVRAANNSLVVASFRADLSGLSGSAAVVFASGLLGGSPGFGLFAALPNGSVVALPITPTTRVQVVHNSPDPTVDVYAGNSLLLDNFAFRRATNFLNIPSDRNIRIGVAPGNSGGANDALATFEVNFATGKNYTVFASGIVGNPLRPFTLIVDDAAQLTAPTGQVSLSVVHGSPDAPAVDVAVRLVGNLQTNIAYGQIRPYQTVAAGPYFVDIKLAGSNDIAATFLADLSGLSGQAIRVFASGLLAGSPDFGLFAVLPNGTVLELPYAPVARVQLVHNSPEPTVDVYVEDTRLLDDFAFRTATPFFFVPADVPLNLGVAPAGSQSASEAIANFNTTFENGKTYVVFASGEVGGTPAFSLLALETGRERAVNPGAVELALLHGAPDAPAVNLTDYFDGTPLVSNFSYGTFTDYVSFPADLLLVDVAPSSAPTQSLGVWGGDFSDLQGLVGVVFASGYLSKEPGFDLLFVGPDGTIFPLPSFARGQVIHNSASPTVDVYLDEFQALNDFPYHASTGFGLFPAGVPFTLGVAPENSVSSSDAIYTLAVDGLDRSKSYIFMAAGKVGDPTKPFELFVNENGALRSNSSGTTALSVFHGSTNAPEVDVQLPGGLVVFDNIAYGEFTNYLNVPSAQYIIELTPANDNNTVVKRYVADASTLGGQAAVLYASGELGGNPKFEVWATLASGITFPLPELVRTNTLASDMKAFILSPNPAVSSVWARFELEKETDLWYQVRDNAGRLVLEGGMGTVSSGSHATQIEVGHLASGMYQLELRSAEGVQTRKLVVQH